MKLFPATILLFMAVAVMVSASTTSNNKIDYARIQFKISGRDLPNPSWCGTTHASAQAFLSENSGKREQLGDKTNTVHNTPNPDWSTIFEFDFDRSKGQELHFDVFGDWGDADSKIATGTINATDFVDTVGRADREMNVPLTLSPGGSLQLRVVGVREGFEITSNSSKIN